LASVDISIRGAGIFGLAIAWVCLRRGASVEVVDPGGVASGASGGVVGALAPHVPENWTPKKQFQLDSLLAAEAFWAKIAAVSGYDPGYRRSGRIQPLATQDAVHLARTRADGARRLWRDTATWSVTQAAGGWQVTSPTGAFVYDTLSAHVHPRRACLALAQALARHGVRCSPEPARPAACTIWATGAAGLADLSRAMGWSLGNGVKGQAALLDLDLRDRPQLFVEGLHVIPHTDGTVAVGSTTERDFEAPNSTDARLEDVIAKARDLVPDVAEAPVLQRWAGLRPRARSRAPMLGPWPGRTGHFIANGGFKIGFGMATGVARVMADLVLEGQDRIPDGFRVEDNF